MRFTQGGRASLRATVFAYRQAYFTATEHRGCGPRLRPCPHERLVSFALLAGSREFLNFKLDLEILSRQTRRIGEHCFSAWREAEGPKLLTP